MDACAGMPLLPLNAVFATNSRSHCFGEWQGLPLYCAHGAPGMAGVGTRATCAAD